MSISEDLASMSAVLSELVPKEDGNLVRADDWNDLVAQLQVLGTIVGVQQTNYESNLARITTVETGLGEVTGRVDDIETQIGSSADAGTIIARLDDLDANKLDRQSFTQYQATLDPLLLQYTVTLATESASYALGDVAVLTATVRRLDGATVNSRPWLDFLISWGDVQAVSGFETRPGTGGRSVSVRTNAQGVAQVRIKAESVAKTSVTDDSEMQAFFASQVSSQGQNKSMREAIFEAESPQDNHVRAMFAEASQRYDTGAKGLRVAADQYYVDRFRKPDLQRVPAGQWLDYRSTIAVFAKDDSNPSTPDFGRGVSSIQITFRDWIGPWIVDYKPDLPHATGPWQLDIPSIMQDAVFKPDQLVKYFNDRVLDQGLLGRHKTMESMGAVINKMAESQVNPGASPFIAVAIDAFKTQKSMDFVSSFNETTGQPIGMAAVAQAVNQAAGTGTVKGQVKLVDTKVGTVGGKAAALESNYSALNLRLNETSVQGEGMKLKLDSIDQKVGNINIVDADSVRGSVSAIKADIAALRFTLNPQR